ncbi:MAG: efflux RND transporter periplasmic adaptor subunit, partial [Rhodospirillales bacterium]|nr:efflux RND transporter periplasmic adaptor subunit [Rhodospirillales bacterium]
AMDVRQENLAEAKAILRQRKIEFDVARELSARNFRSKVKLAEAEAVLQSATSAVARIELDIRRVRIDAPFDGVLDRRAVEIGDVVPVGGAVATIVDLTPIYIVGHVSELDVNKVQKGATAKALLVNGSTVRGKVRFVASEADEATRTYRVEIVADNTDRRIIAGMTAEIRIELAPVSAHKISPAVLTLADAGMVGVKTVGADGVVAFYAINIVDEDASGAWITGLAKRVTLITIGQEFVKSGEKVDPVPEPGPVLTNAKGDAS